MIRTFKILIKRRRVGEYLSLSIRFWFKRWAVFTIDHLQYYSCLDPRKVNLYKRTVKKEYFFDVVKEIQDNFPEIDFGKINFDLTAYGL